jgi:hypothetical protein
MVMIPGALEPRRSMAPAAAVIAVAIPDERLTESRGDRLGADTKRAELSNWMELTIAAAILLAVMWLAMAAFYRGRPVNTGISRNSDNASAVANTAPVP